MNEHIAPQRLQKVIAALGIASRREVESWIEAGRIKINGAICRELGVKVDPKSDKVKLDNKILNLVPASKLYWMMHKPDKVLCSRKSEPNKKTIYDLPSLKNMKLLLNPMGRLDFRTEGLLILSNDGELAHFLTHPSMEIERCYHVLVDGELSKEQLIQIKTKKLNLDKTPDPRVEIRFVHHKKLTHKIGSWYIVSVFEGRNRLVRRIFEHFNLQVKRLIRVKFGPIGLDESLKPGACRQLSSQELKLLKKSAQKHST